MRECGGYLRKLLFLAHPQPPLPGRSRAQERMTIKSAKLDSACFRPHCRLIPRDVVDDARNRDYGTGRNYEYAIDRGRVKGGGKEGCVKRDHRLFPNYARRDSGSSATILDVHRLISSHRDAQILVDACNAPSKWRSATKHREFPAVLCAPSKKFHDGTR